MRGSRSSALLPGRGLIPTEPSSVHRFSVGIHNRRCSTMEFFKLADFLSHLGWVVFENFEFTTRALNSDSKRRFHFIPPSQLRTSSAIIECNHRIENWGLLRLLTAASGTKRTCQSR